MYQDRHLVARATAHDSDILASLFSVGFLEDPMHRWLFPDDDDRARLHPAFFAPLVAMALKDGEVWTTQNRNGAALWLPFDARADSHGPGLGDLFEATLGPEYAERLREYDRQASVVHPAHCDHACLAFVVVRPGLTGRGIGTALLEKRLAALDRQGVPAYLEATNADSARLYERLGFGHLDGAIRMPGGPVLRPMWREPAG
jgi:GNAT superfamily N-acetyltransferase